MFQPRRVFERVLSRVFFGEKIKGIKHSDLRHEIYPDAELPRRLREYQPCLPVGKWVLLPVKKLPRRINTERIRFDDCTRMRRRTQAHDVRRQPDRAIVGIIGNVAEFYPDHAARMLQISCQDPVAQKSTAPGLTRAAGDRQGVYRPVVACEPSQHNVWIQAVRLLPHC